MRFVLAMVIGGGVLVFLGYQEWTLASGTSAEPQKLTCSQLIEKGTGGNAHVEMGDFMLCNWSYVYEGATEDSMTTVWVPAVPIDGEFAEQVVAQLQADPVALLQGGMPPVPRDVRVIVKSSKVDNDAEVTGLGDQQTIRGMVVNEISSLDSKEKKLLQESYPQADFDKVLILEHGRQPAGAAKMMGLFLGGLALMVVGGFIGMGMMGSNESRPRPTSNERDADDSGGTHSAPHSS